MKRSMGSRTDGNVVRRVISQCLGYSFKHIKPEQKLEDDLGADSLDRVEIAMALEAEFEIELPEERWEKVLTVGDAVEAVKEARK